MNRTASPMLSVRGLCKRFGPVRALQDVDLDLHAGDVHALVGENGAGKSTLSKIIAGIVHYDAGCMSLDGVDYRPAGRKDAQRSGVRMVMQELNLIANLSVAENIFLDRLPHTWGVISYGRLHQRSRDLMNRVGLGGVDPALPVRQLGVGMRQLIEITAGLSQQCRLLILDEPTASLTDSEVALLFEQIENLKSQGVAILYISHRMEEIKRIADHITILRDGRHICTTPAGQLTVDEIVNRMVGRDLSQEQLDRGNSIGPVVLRVEGLAIAGKVHGVSFSVRRGEVLGFAGLMGSGRTETMRGIFGADPITSGRIFLHGSETPIRIKSPRRALRNGIALLTEDRKEQGLLLPQDIRVNSTLSALSSVSVAGVLQAGRERRAAADLVERLSIRCSSPQQPVETLSGGNQQKVVVAKWLFTNCDILIFDEPTRGIDVGAKFEIYHTLTDLAGRGKAVLVVSSDLKELMLVSDRIAVMSSGRLVASFDREEFSEEKINAAAFSAYVNSSNHQEYDEAI